MSLNFIIADDQKTALESTCSHIKKLIAENQMDASVSLCTTIPEDVLDYSEKHSKEMNVYILDIYFQSEVNGLTLGRAIRDREPNAYIIYLTAQIQLSMMVFKYKLKVFDFLVKPVSYSDLEDCFKALVKDYTKVLDSHLPAKDNFISIKSGYQEHHLSVNNIVYIESFGPKLAIHTINGQIEYYGALRDIEKSINEITDTFYRSHKSFLINTQYIEEVDLKAQAVTMSTGDRCLVSRNKKNFLKENYLNR